jgi:hypothetical protein
MQNVRYEGSLLASLEELKRIEQQRVAEEQAAIEKAASDREQARLDAERREREAVEAKARAEHEQRLATERAKLEAEREARLRMEAEDAAERGRQMMVLEEKRAAAELELRREEVRKKRPTWMIAVTGLSIALAGLLVWLALAWYQNAQRANEEKVAADQAAEKARADARVAIADLAQVEKQLGDLNVRVNEAIDEAIKAEGVAKAKEAQAKLKRLHDEQARIEADRAQKQKAAEDAIRKAGLKMTDECLRNPLCMQQKPH